MHIKSIVIKNFRCFDTLSLDFTSKIVMINGANGIGKTSLLEALHYMCYLRSFRTYTPRELVAFDQSSFFIKAEIEAFYNTVAQNYDIQIGYASKKKLVKIDQKVIVSYKELTDYYRIVTLTEDDLELIKGSPEQRRAFIDQALVLQNHEFLKLMHSFKHTLENRNALLQSGSYSSDSYMLWAQQLWQYSLHIQNTRNELLKVLEARTNKLLVEGFDSQVTIKLLYQPKRIHLEQSFDDFIKENPELPFVEKKMGRSLFGAHLDEINIQFCDKASRAYASRGQQKLTVLLLKIAQIQEILEKKGPIIFLLDDFMTDFDEEKSNRLLDILINLNCQLFFTSPIINSSFETYLASYNAQIIQLPS